jgi:thiosulfate dehydrogenase [quinone] large subunit
MAEPRAGLTGPQWAYAIFRFTIGVNFLMHGLVRVFGDYSGFVDGLSKKFTDTVLPMVLVRGFCWAVPPLEVLIGALLVVGFATVPSLAAGGLLMTLFVFGACLIEDWSLVASQMIYVIAFYLALRDVGHNALALDRR